MNNYILNNGSCLYNNHTYNYVETNNHYACPYVFKTSNTVVRPYIYFKSMPFNSGSGVIGYTDPDGIKQTGLLLVIYDVKAWGVATTNEASDIGGEGIGDNQLIIKNSLSEYNCELKDTTTIVYDSNNLCINYDDIKKKLIPEPNIFIYHIYLNHNTGIISENSNNLIYKKTQDSGWENDEKPQNYNDSIRTDINLTIMGSLYGHIGDIIKPFAPASEERYYTYDTYTNMYYSYTLYSNNTCTYEWGFDSSKIDSQSGTTENITGFVGNIVPPAGETFDGNAVYSTKTSLYFEKEYKNATINGKTIKLYLTID